MAKRATGLSSISKKKGPHKTKKRLAIKKLAKEATKNKKFRK